MGEHHPGEDAPDGPGNSDNHGINWVRGVCLHSGPKSVISVVDSKYNLVWLFGFYCLDVQVVEVMVDLGWNLGCHHEQSVWGKNKDSVVCFIIALFELH